MIIDGLEQEAEVRIVNYIFCPLCRNYTATLRISIFDHFGLDKEDAEDRSGHFEPLSTVINSILPESIQLDVGGNHWGVYGWYVLQHYIGFGNGYRPFITEAHPEVSIGRQSRPSRTGGITWI